MPEVKTEVPKLSLLDQLRQQHQQFVKSKILAENNLNQLVGAIYACELMIKKHEIEGSNEELPGDLEDVEAVQPTEEEAA